MLTSAMAIKTPHPSYKVPGLEAGPAADATKAPVAPVLKVGCNTSRTANY